MKPIEWKFLLLVLPLFFSLLLLFSLLLRFYQDAEILDVPTIEEMYLAF